LVDVFVEGEDVPEIISVSGYPELGFLKNFGIKNMRNEIRKRPVEKGKKS
jgi:hypothetical protein